ncbi:MAG: tRNA-dihydrouridine synthase [Tissierellales bacterium]
MIIYPAIDIRNGKCVRLVQGKAENETIYGEDPIKIAKKWEDMGARFLHVVDLDGAFEGDAGNKDIIKKIAANSSIPIQVGGGIRSMERIEEYLELTQIARVIIGTAAITNPDLLNNALSKYGKKFKPL